MHIILAIIALAIWLLTLWLGSIALEATGMERRKARFQCLSAITGTGFTTTEAEAVVNHPRRRRIASVLIFAGYFGLTGFMVALILSLKIDLVLVKPSIPQIGVIVIVILIIVAFIKFGILNKITNGIVRLMRKGHPAPHLLTEEVLHQTGDYGVARVAVSGKAEKGSLCLKDTGFWEKEFTVLAIERGNTVLPRPKAEEMLLAGDYLLCYGKVPDMINISR